MPIRLILALFGLAIAQPALAQQQEPPSRVGAVGYVLGNIAFHMAGETQWSAAGVNYPVATGGSFWTDPQSRAELQIGPSTIDMAGGTEIDVTNLNEQVAQIGIPEGRLYLHLRQLDAGQSFEIDLPQGAVWLLQPGSYDIDAGTTGEPARVAVFAGEARFVGNGIDSGIKAGDAVMLSGSNPVSAQVAPVAPDAFVEWCRARDYHQNQVAAAARYISPQMTGYADLDQYGGWQNSPQYGEVWYPSQVPADWAPYRDGRWIWVQPWGWTWVDQEPWGFAPFHYGRWAYAGDRWGWIPGQYVAQPVYAPALVAFVGAAVSGFAVSGGGGPAVGWFPLAPNEPYWPSYTRNANYIRNVNIANVKNIDTIVVHSNGMPPAQVENTNFANRRFATVVPQRVFANADPVARAAIHVTPAALEKAPVVLHPPAVQPAAKPAAVAVRGPVNTRPVAKGPGIPPPVHPASAASGLPGTPPPETAPAHGPGPVRAGAAANPAAIPPHPGAAYPTERGANARAAPGAGKAPGPPQPAGPHPAAPPNIAAPPPSRPGTPAPAANAARGTPPARPAAAPRPLPPEQAQAFHPPKPAVIHPAPAVAHPPAPALVHPAPAVTHPPAPALVHPAPAVTHPPAPTVIHPAPAVTHPPAPTVIHPAPAVAHPPAPVVVRPAPVVARPPAPAVVRPPPAPPRPPIAPHPPAAHAPPSAGGGGKPAPRGQGKEGDKHP